MKCLWHDTKQYIRNIIRRCVQLSRDRWVQTKQKPWGDLYLFSSVQISKYGAGKTELSNSQIKNVIALSDDEIPVAQSFISKNQGQQGVLILGVKHISSTGYFHHKTYSALTLVPVKLCCSLAELEWV